MEVSAQGGSGGGGVGGEAGATFGIGAGAGAGGGAGAESGAGANQGSSFMTHPQFKRSPTSPEEVAKKAEEFAENVPKPAKRSTDYIVEHHQIRRSPIASEDVEKEGEKTKGVASLVKRNAGDEDKQEPPKQ